MAKILSLVLAIAIWFLINDHLGPGRFSDDGKDDSSSTEYRIDENGKRVPIPKATPVRDPR